jgi:transcription elongation factor Elf1
MKKYIAVRCYKCNNETEAVLDVTENISDLMCNICQKYSMELNVGKRAQQIYSDKNDYQNI